MATTAQGYTAANKNQYSRAGAARDSPQAATPQNIKVDNGLANRELNNQTTAKASSQASNFVSRGNERQVMTLQNSHIHGRKVDSPKIYVNESESRDARPKTSAQGSRKFRNEKKPPQGDGTKRSKIQKPSYGQVQGKTPSGSCPTIFSAMKIQQQPQRIDFTFQKEDLDCVFTSTEHENGSKSRQTDRNANDVANKSTSRLQNTQLSKYQQSRQQANQIKPKSIGISSRVQRKRHLSQSMNAGTATVKHAKVIQLPNDSLVKSPQNLDFSALNASANLTSKMQIKHRQKPDTRERRTRSSDLNSRPSLAAASRKGMQLKNSKVNKSLLSKPDVNSSTTRANGNKQDSDIVGGNDQSRVQKATDKRQHFSFDLENKENYPSNSSLLNQKTKLIASERSKSLSAGRSKTGQQRKNKLHNKLSLSSLSRSSPNLKVEVSGGSITKMLGKQYFVDGEQMLRIMSPGTPTKSQDPLKSLVSGGHNNSETRKSSPNKYSNSRKQREARHRKKSEDAIKRTLDSKSGERGQSKDQNPNHQVVKKERNEKTNKNLDTTLKQKLQAQELLKKFMEETQRKTDRDVHRTKASDQIRLQEILILRSKSKKKRSKSCISKIGEAVLSSRQQVKDFAKESANQTCLLSDALSGSQKRTAPKELSCVVKMGNLKREINDEIRRERKETGELPRTAQTPGASKPLYDHREAKLINKANSSTLNYASLRLSDPHELIEQQKKSEDRAKKDIKGRGSGDINHSKIRKYIERQKKKQQVKRSMEETITHEKHLRIKQTLWDLQNFQKTKERSTPQQISSGPLRLTSHSINLKKIQPTTGKSSSQQIQLLDHVRNHLPIKNLRVNHTTKALKKKKKPFGNFNESSQFDSMRDMGNKTGMIDDEATVSQLEATYNQQEPILEDDDSTTNINIFSKEISPTISSNTGNQKSKSPSRRVNTDIISEYPLKELKSKIVKQKPSGSAKGPSKRRSQDQSPTQNQKTLITITANSNATANFKQSDFESLEPSRPTGHEDNKNSKMKSRSTPKTNSDQINNLYDQSAVVVRRKPDSDLEKTLAATKIQKYVRGHLTRKQIRRVLSQKDSPIISSAPLTEKNNTAQSVRKNMNIPSLNLQKINSSDSNPHKAYTVATAQNNKQISQETNSARSQTLFDRGSFQQIKQTGIILPQQEQVENIPEMIQIREENIRRQQESEQRNLQLELSQNKVSPRTYQMRQRDLEIWVSKEREKVTLLIPKQKAVEKEWEKTEQYMRNAYQDFDQINKILGSARSSQKSKQPPRHLIAEDLLASSARTGLNSYRIDSQRQSHRVEENRLIDLIYEKKPSTDKGLQESSSNSQVKQNLKNNSNSQNSKSNSQSQNYESPRDQDSDLENEFPDFDKVVVLNQTKKLPIQKLSQTNGEPTLNRQTSYKLLGEQTVDAPDTKPDLKNSPKYLSKTDARSRLHDLVDEEVDELARQVFQVSPAASSEQSRQAAKDDFKESLKSDSFFLKKTDQGPQSPQIGKNSNIRIEIGDEDKQNSQAVATALIGTVSPLSDASSNLGIQRGCMSLESSTSGENREKLAQVIQDLKSEEQASDSLNKQQIEFGEHLTNEILQLLVAEMKLDFEFLVNRDAAQVLKIQQQQQQDQMSLQQLAGIKTDLFAIEKYVDEVVEEIKLNSVEFMKVLNAPMSKNHVQLLNQLQNTEIGSCEHFSENFPQILPLDLYLTLEKRRKEVRELQTEQTNERGGAGSQTEMLRILIAECEHIHNKVLFDCINDSLLQFKPYGKDGEPVPWGRKNRRLKPTDDFTIGEIFEIVKHDLFRWAITQAGTLPRREFVYRGVFDEELFSEIREKKLVSLLGREMIENEPKWLNYEFEQAQVKIDVGDMILEVLVTETIKILSESGVSQEDLASHPLMTALTQSGDNNEGKKPLEPYEAHILAQMGINGAQQQDSRDQSDNSKDSDFSRNEVDSSAYVLADEFDDNYFDDDRS